jgi:hypothetical protein
MAGHEDALAAGVVTASDWLAMFFPTSKYNCQILANRSEITRNSLTC